MNSQLAIKNLEAYKKQVTDQNKWARNIGLSSVFDEMIRIADEQIELYKVGKGRLQNN